MLGMLLAALLALVITCYAYAYISVYTNVNDALATVLFYSVTYIILRSFLLYGIGF